jgi:hypothetical protein
VRGEGRRGGAGRMEWRRRGPGGQVRKGCRARRDRETCGDGEGTARRAAPRRGRARRALHGWPRRGARRRARGVHAPRVAAVRAARAARPGPTLALPRPPPPGAARERDPALQKAPGGGGCGAHLAHETVAVLGEGHHGGRRAAALGVGHDGGLAALHRRGGAVGGAQVDADDLRGEVGGTRAAWAGAPRRPLSRTRAASAPARGAARRRRRRPRRPGGPRFRATPAEGREWAAKGGGRRRGARRLPQDRSPRAPRRPTRLLGAHDHATAAAALGLGHGGAHGLGPARHALLGRELHRVCCLAACCRGEGRALGWTRAFAFVRVAKAGLN